MLCLGTLPILSVRSRHRKRGPRSEDDADSSDYDTDDEDEAEEERQCSVCLSRRKQIVLNCGHQFCGSCSEGLLLCAMCRTPITHRIKLF